MKKFDDRLRIFKFFSLERLGIFFISLLIVRFRILRLLYWFNFGGIFLEMEFDVRIREVRFWSLYKEGEILLVNDIFLSIILVIILVFGL